MSLSNNLDDKVAYHFHRKESHVTESIALHYYPSSHTHLSFNEVMRQCETILMDF